MGTQSTNFTHHKPTPLITDLLQNLNSHSAGQETHLLFKTGLQLKVT